MTERWEDVPGCPGFQVSWDGNFRSVDRVSPSGRRLKGKPVPTRPSNRGYALVDLRDAEGKRLTRSAHSVVLETFAGARPTGMESRHYDDNGQNNRWRPGGEKESRAAGGNLFWGTEHQNRVVDRARNRPPAPAKPKPQRGCARCGGPFEGNGRRCHPCVESIGRDAAARLARGETLAAAMKALDYPSAEGLHLLAVKYGRYGARKTWWSRSVKPKVVTLSKRIPGKRRSRTVSKSRPARAAKSETPPEGRKSEAGFRIKPGLSGTSGTRAVTERDAPRSDRVPPLPADLALRNQPRKLRRSR
jgi:hypothetical protein